LLHLLLSGEEITAEGELRSHDQVRLSAAHRFNQEIQVVFGLTEAGIKLEKTDSHEFSSLDGAIIALIGYSINQ